MKDYHKHLSLSQRIIIEQGLNDRKTFTAIATSIRKNPTTISKEVRKHRTIKHHRNPNKKPACAHWKSCQINHLCSDCYSVKLCKDCSKCRFQCTMYKPKECRRLHKSPYACNSCGSLCSCPHFRWTYVAKYADDSYHQLLRSSREGINQTADAMQEVDYLVSPLILKGQSIAHIYATHKNEHGCSRRTLNKYIDQNIFTARNVDLPSKIKYKPRRVSFTHTYNTCCQNWKNL